MKRIEFIDGLRGIASLMIVFHHSVTSYLAKLLTNYNLNTLANSLISFTQSGVELFFVLSGIVLLKPYFKGIKKLDIPKFYKRRFKRIYPTYFFAVVFAAFVIAVNTFMPTWYSEVLVKMNLENFVKQFFIFNQAWDYYNLAWWSLQIEVMFYILCPLIIFIVSQTGKRYFKFHPFIEMLLLVIISISFQLVFTEYFPLHYSTAKHFFNLYRIVDYIPAFYLGSSIAYSYWSPNKTKLGFAFAVVLYAAGHWYSPATNMAFGFFYSSIISTLLIKDNYQKYLSSYTMMWFGERSYSLFLTHFSVFYCINYSISYFLPERNFLYGFLSRSIGISAAIFVMMLFFWFVERKTARGLKTANDFLPKMY